MSSFSEAGESLTFLLSPVPGLPEPCFAPGYSARRMTAEDIPLWIEVQRAAEPYFKTPDTLFMDEFGKPEGEAWKRCYILFSPHQEPAGVISAWWKDDFLNGAWGQLHWLAVHPEHQHKGLARALCLMVIHRLDREFGRVFLHTQSKRTAAIALYESIGFRRIALPQPG